MRLVYENDRDREVRVGDVVKVGGVDVKVSYFRPPHKPASSGKICVKDDRGFEQEFYVGVIDAVWIEREDRSWP